MKRKFLLKLISIMTAVLVLVSVAAALTACKDKKGGEEPEPNGEQQDNENVNTSINAPSDAAVDSDGLVTWSRVSGAASYDVEVNGNITNVKFTRFNLYEVKEKPEGGRFSIRVRTVAKDGSKSAWSNMISYTISGGALLYPVITGVENGVISWYANNDAQSAIVTVNGNSETLSKDTTSYDISKVAGEEITFSVMFKGDGVYYKDSKVNTVIYYPATKEVRLPAPANVHMDGQILKFDEVIGADIYYLRDYNNTVISVTTNEIDMSSGYLTKTVKAGITSGVYSDSKEADVTYFDAQSGNGTEESPFVIKTADEFRYIEFYEGTGKSMYYTLGNDIVFEQIETKGDYASNAYKLGSFSGVFDGKNHKLINVTVHYRDGYSSLFSSINEGAEFKNVIFDNADWRTWTVKSNDGVMHQKGGEVAILCYTNRGIISDVQVVGSSIVAEQDGAAGLVSINRGEINRCTIGEGTRIYGNREAGGIAIYNEGTVANCVNKGTIEGNLSIGGIVGRNAGVVNTCTNQGKVKGIRRVGGIVGYNYNVLLDGDYEFRTEVRFCCNLGEVTGSTVVGGIVGQNGGDGTEEIGALSVAGAGVKFSYNAGSVKGGSVLGGIAGSNFATKSSSRGIVGSFNVGTVATDSSVTASYTRLFVDTSACDWVANDNARMYCHYWGTSGSSVWPGVVMNSFNYNNKLYYYVDIDVENLKGVIFSRGDYSGNVFNSTANLLPTTSTLYYLAGDFSGDGTWGLAAEVQENMPTVTGALAGFNAAVDDCYYLKGSAPVSSAANGTLQTNQVNVTGSFTAELTSEQINSAEFVAFLNSVAGTTCWTVGTDHPVFAWQ